MLTACATSQGPPAPEPRPIVKVERRIETVCPAEVTAEMPAAVPLPPGAVLEGNADGLGYASGRFRREELLEGRLRDARAACPKS